MCTPFGSIQHLEGALRSAIGTNANYSNRVKSACSHLDPQRLGRVCAFPRPHLSIVIWSKGLPRRHSKTYLCPTLLFMSSHVIRPAEVAWSSNSVVSPAIVSGNSCNTLPCSLFIYARTCLYKSFVCLTVRKPIRDDIHQCNLVINPT